MTPIRLRSVPSQRMRSAGISIDVDSVASHLEGYGFERPEEEGEAYRLAIPRALEIFERAGVRCTFFLVAADAERHPEVVWEIAARGHEIASHSMTHRLPFASLGAERLVWEIEESKASLEAITGIPVVGFRAPSCDLPPVILEHLVNAGYLYDASSDTSLLLPLLRRAVGRRGASAATRNDSGLWSGVFDPALPHPRTSDGRRLAEIPMCTAPGIRFPYCHTLRFLLPAPVFGVVGRLARLRRGAVNYQFHAVDFLDLKRDDLDSRIGRHPGMSLLLERKLKLAELAVKELSRDRRVVPLAHLALDVLEASEAPAAVTEDGRERRDPRTRLRAAPVRIPSLRTADRGH